MIASNDRRRSDAAVFKTVWGADPSTLHDVADGDGLYPYTTRVPSGFQPEPRARTLHRPRTGTSGGIRTHTADALDVVTPADWSTLAC